MLAPQASTMGSKMFVIMVSTMGGKVHVIVASNVKEHEARHLSKHHANENKSGRPPCQHQREQKYLSPRQASWEAKSKSDCHPK